MYATVPTVVPVCATPSVPASLARPKSRILTTPPFFGWSLSNLIALLRHQLFVYRDLTAWLDAPFEGPPALADIDAQQLALDWRR